MRLRDTSLRPLVTLLAPLAALLLLGPDPASGVVHVSCGGTGTVVDAVNWGTWTNSNNGATNGTTTNTRWAYFTQGAAAPAVPAAGFRAFTTSWATLSTGTTGSTWTERKKGYLNRIRWYIDYSLNPSAFTNDRIEGTWSTDNAATWQPPFLAPNYPVVDATAVTTLTSNLPTTTAKIYMDGGLQGKAIPDISAFDTWARLAANLRVQARWLGYNGAGAQTALLGDVDNTTFWINGLYIKYLVKLTAIGANVAPAALNPQGMTQIPRLRLNLKRFTDTNFDIKDIKVNLTGTVAASDIAQISLYLDATSNGTFTKNAETLKGTATVSGAVGSVTGTFSGAPLINNVGNGTTRYYFVTVDFADDAVVGRTCGMTMLDESFIVPYNAVDMVASNADQNRTGCVWDTDPKPLWPFATTSTATVSQKANPVNVFTVPAAPAAYTSGDNFNVTIRVTNPVLNGNTPNTCKTVLPNAPVVTSSDGGGAITSTVLTSVNTLASGSFTDFTWVFSGTSPGTITITATTSCLDNTTLRTVTSAPASSQVITINPSPTPVLQFTGFDVAPLYASNDGQPVYVQIAVKNVGTVMADAVSLYPVAGTTAQVWLLSNTGTANSAAVFSAPSNPQTIAPGNTVLWNYVYTAGPTAGTLTLKCEARGDNFTTATGTSNPIAVVARADVQNVSNTTSIAPDIGINTSFTLTYIVQNNGGTIATLLVPPTPTLTTVVAGNPPPALTSGPSPAGYATLDPGATAQFDWIYDTLGGTTANGQYRLGASTAYHDAGSGKSYSSGALDCAVFKVVNMVTPATVSASRNGSVRKLITYDDSSTYYVLDESGLLTAFNPDAGHTVKWSFNFMAAALTSPEAVDGTMIACSVEAEGTVVWVGTNDGRVFAILDGGTAAAGYIDDDVTLSFTQLGASSPILVGPIVWGQYLYAASGDMICKRDKANGGMPTLWADYSVPGGATVTTAPAVDNNYIYFGCSDGKLYCISAATGAYVSSTASFGGEITASPFTIGNNVIYSGNADGILIRLNDPTDLSNVTSVDLDGGAAHGALSDLWVGLALDYIWVTDTGGGNLYKCNFANLTVAQSHNYAGRTLTMPIEWNGVVYFSVDWTANGNRGEFYAVNKAGLTALANWPYQIGTAGSGSSCPTTLDVAKTMFITGSDNKKVYFFGMPVP